MSTLKQLSPNDAMFLAGESPCIYQHTAGLVILDSSKLPDFGFDSFREFMIERMSRVPHFQWKLHEVPMGLDMPYWVEDEDFSFNNHLKRIAVPSPGDRNAVGEVISHLYTRHLDRSKPLWEIWFIEGLAGGKCAILQKLHHCMMDGQAAKKLGEIMGDITPDALPHELDPVIRDAKAGDVPSRWEQSRNTANHLARLPWTLSSEVVGFARPRIWNLLTGNAETKPPRPEVPKTCFNTDVSSDRSFVFRSLPLEDIKTVKTHFNATVNDVILALISSAVRQYLLDRGELPKTTLRASIAVSTRIETDKGLDNKVTNIGVTLASNLAAPADRLLAISSETGAAAREARSGGRGVTEVLQMMPPIVMSTMFSLTPADMVLEMTGANMMVSSMRGGDQHLYIAGARAETMYPMSIISSGIGMNFTCISYAGNVDFGLTVDPHHIDDPWRLIDSLEPALAEYLSLVDQQRPARPQRTPASRKKGSPTAKKARKAVPKKGKAAAEK